MTYAYAVIDGNDPPDSALFAESCHRTFEAAAKAARRHNNKDPNAHYYVVEWAASRWAKLRPNDDHYPCQQWLEYD